MHISTSISLFGKLGSVKDIVSELKKSGFTAYDYTMCSGEGKDTVYSDNYLEIAKDLRKHADSVGIVCNQSHAPFPSAKVGDEEYNKGILPILIRAIEISGILGSKVCVVHPCNDYTAEENAKIYKALEPHARKSGVMIATENMWNWGDWNDPASHAEPAACSDHIDFNKHLDLLPSDVFCACVDIGHAEMKGLNTSASIMLEALGERVKAIHLHDNDKHLDFHQIPFSGRIDFNKVIESLKKINYKGDITLESDGTHFEKALIPASMRYMAEVAKYFVNELSK